MRRSALVVACVAALGLPSSARARDTAGPSLAGSHVFLLGEDGSDDAFALGFEGHVTGAPALAAGMDLGWAFEESSAFLDLFFGVGWAIVTVGPAILGTVGSPGAGLSLGPQLCLAVPFPLVGDASLVQAFGRYDHFLLGETDYAHRVVVGLRIVLDTTRPRGGA